MKNIFRVPVDVKHFADTIEKGKTYDEILPFVTSTDAKALAEIAQNNTLHYWGSIAGSSNIRTFTQIEEEDEILFYRAGKYIALATIALKIINPSLARYSWGEREDKFTWELMYFLKDVQTISIDKKSVNTVLGYKENASVMGFSMISKQTTSQFINTYGSIANFVKQLSKRNLQNCDTIPYMNETQQILEAIKRLEEGLKSVRSEMATKADLSKLETATQLNLEDTKKELIISINDTKKELTAKIDAVKEDTEAIRSMLDTGTGSLSDDINYLLHKTAKLEKELKDLKLQYSTSK